MDDEPKLLRALRRRYEQVKFEVRTALDGHEALHLVHEWTPEVALVDLHLGAEDGLQIVHDLRRLLPNARIILISAAVSGETASLAHRLGADAVVEKDKRPLEYLGFQDSDGPTASNSIPSLDVMKRALVDRALRRTEGNYTQAATLIGIDRRTLIRWLDAWGIR